MSRGYGTTFGAGTTDSIKSRYTAASSIFSLSIWAYRNADGGSGVGRMLIHDGTGGSGDIQFYNNGGGNLTFQVPFSGGTAGWTCNRPATNSWHSIILTYDGTSASNAPVIYVDGVSQTVTGSASGTINLPTLNWYVGNRADGARNWDGMLAHAAIWNITLAAPDAMVLALGASPLIIRPDSLQSYMPLDGVNNPEFDFINGNSSSITGTRLGTREPPVMPIARIRSLFDYQSDISIAPITTGVVFRRTLSSIGARVGSRQEAA